MKYNSTRIKWSAAAVAVASGLAVGVSSFAHGAGLSPQDALIANLKTTAMFSSLTATASSAGLTAAQNDFLNHAVSMPGSKIASFTAFGASATRDFTAAIGSTGGCIVTTDGGGSCGPVDALDTGDLFLLAFDTPPKPEPGQDLRSVLPTVGTPYPATISGVAPDGFSRIDATTVDGSVVSAPIIANTYEIHGTFTKLLLISASGGTSLPIRSPWFAG